MCRVGVGVGACRGRPWWDRRGRVALARAARMPKCLDGMTGPRRDSGDGPGRTLGSPSTSQRDVTLPSPVSS